MTRREKKNRVVRKAYHPTLMSSETPVAAQRIGGEIHANECRIVRMDTLSSEQTKMVEDIFHGDGTCSLSNLNVACFASERCNRPNAFETGPRTMASMAKNTFVTLDTQTGDVLAFASMVPMSQCRFLTMSYTPPTGMFVCNLCVRESVRSNGHGRRLLEHLCKHSPDSTFLAVRRVDEHASDEVKAFMRTRSEKLLKMYKKLLFKVVDTNDTYYVLQKNTNNYDYYKRYSRHRGLH